MKLLVFTVAIAVFVSASLAGDVLTNRPRRLHKDDARAGPGFTRVFSEVGQAGYFYDFTDYVPDLSFYDFDDVISSSCQTGLWFYYEQVQYNQSPGKVYWMHGIEFCSDFPIAYEDVTSSLRYSGSPFGLNDDSFNLYQGEYFTGNEFWGEQDFAALDYMDNDCSSLVLTGLSPWTLFSEINYQGFALCVFPNTDHDVGADGTTIDYGIFPTITELGFPDNSVSSVAKGCFSDNIAVVHRPGAATGHSP